MILTLKIEVENKAIAYSLANKLAMRNKVKSLKIDSNKEYIVDSKNLAKHFMRDKNNAINVKKKRQLLFLEKIEKASPKQLKNLVTTKGLKMEKATVSNMKTALNNLIK